LLEDAAVIAVVKRGTGQWPKGNHCREKFRRKRTHDDQREVNSSPVPAQKVNRRLLN
jgi:hypothetical protein